MNCVLEKEKKCKNVIHDALKVLGKKNLAFISHGGSFPSMPEENPGFGTPNSSGGKKLIDFCSEYFNAIQLGPQGITKSNDASPYVSTIFSGNTLFIDLEELTTSKWHNILSKKAFKDICNNNPNKYINKASYKYILNAQEDALKQAFQNFQKAKIFVREYNKFKKENIFWLEKDALYSVLSIEHKNDYYPLWKNETDKKLFNPKTLNEKKVFEKRIEEIKAKYADEFEFYNFCQFVLFMQNTETRKYALTNGIKMIADRQVAFSDRDMWAYQALFLEGWCLGCPPDYFSKNGQAWGFPVINPEKMFNEDGSLGKGGELMYQLYKKMFTENPGGVRIDHIVGLIDPWVYKKGCNPKIEEGAGRLYSSPEHPELQKFAIATLDDLNYDVTSDKEQRIKTLNEEQIKQYGAIIDKIVIAAAKDSGLDKNAIVCEDLGTLTYPVEKVMNAYELLGMRLTQFTNPENPEDPYRCSKMPKKCWAMVGTHDNEPIRMWASKLVYTPGSYPHAKNLVSDLFFEKNEQEKNDLIVRLTTDKEFLAQTKIVELFASKAENVQIFFTDFFGIEDTYNTPGTSGDKNWSLRIPDDFEDFYCEQLEKREAINLPLILKLAIEARGWDFAQKHKTLIKKLTEIS